MMLRIMAGVSSCLFCVSAYAAGNLLREAEPVHLAGCPATPEMLLTSLAAPAEVSVIYRGGMVRGRLGGTLLKQQGKTTIWNAAALLDARTNARTLLTANRAGELIPLQWTHLDEVQRASLRLAAENDETMAMRRLAYLAGDRADDVVAQDLFPPRVSRLGAIVHGIALRVGQPVAMVSPGYQDFYERYRHRRAVVYVGAGDGMLHAFADDTGEELFAYAPRALFGSLIRLTSTSLPSSVPFDGGMTSSSVFAKGKWLTLLVAGFGTAAKGLVALDVSDPDNLSARHALLWEFSDQDDPDIAHVIGTPQIVRLRTTGKNGKQQYGYFVAVAGGLNPRAGNALFLLSLDKEPAEAWQPGLNYFKIVADSPAIALPNGMLEFVSVMGQDQAVERMYAGDLQGNIWRLDLASGVSAQDLRATHLFTAIDDTGKRQPIMHKPAVVAALDGKPLLLFGTGRYLSRQDLQPSRFGTQSFYAVRDAGNAVSRSQLAVRRLIEDSASTRLTIDGLPFSYGDTVHGRAGWYMDFPNSTITGERVVSPLLSVGSQIVFASLLPDLRSCHAPAARVYALDAISGLTINAAATGTPIAEVAPLATLLRLTPMSVRKETTIFPEPIPPDRLGKRRRTPTVELVRDAYSPVVLDELSIPDLIGGRLSWRELSEWEGRQPAVNAAKK